MAGRNKHLTLAALLLLAALAGTSQASEEKALASRILDTPHNLTHWSGEVMPGDSLAERVLCRVCHGPRVHEELIPLWDHDLARGPFPMGAKLEAEESGFPADPTSQLCLACHDGSVARAFPPDPARSLGREFELGELGAGSGDHVNTHLFLFDAGSGELQLPDSLKTGMTVRDGRIRCSTCHDAHDNSQGSFLRVTAESGRICLECHQLEGWSHSVHANPDNPVFAEMRHLSCSQCHSIHATPAHDKLLIDDQNSLCFRCHDGLKDDPREVPANKDLREVFRKEFVHPVGFHGGSPFADADESGFIGFLAGTKENRGVQCSDCHNVHAVAEESVSGTLPSSMEGASGVDRLGMEKIRADYEYEVCLKCHGFSTLGLPGQRDVAADFDLSNRSYHPIMAAGTGGYVPSLKEEWSTISTMSCSDCHGNDDPDGPQGPHGSSQPHLLKAAWNESPFRSGSPEENALCFMCHKESRIYSGGWRWHNFHLERGGYSCAACHDPHGSADGPGLIRLDQPWIEPENGEKRIERVSLEEGTCTLKCHGHAHRNSPY